MNKFSHIELDEKKLADQTLDYILKTQNSCLTSSLFIKILDPRVKYGDLNDHIDFLKERLSHLEFKVDYDTVDFTNSLSSFQILDIDELGRTIDNSALLGPLIFEKENFSKEIFWANIDEEMKYQSISNFRSFEDKVIPAEKVGKTIINIPFNIDGWTLYYKNLLNLKFPEFSNEILAGPNVIRYRHLKNDYFLGIETNYKYFKQSLKREYDSEPYHKLIIFKILDRKKIKTFVEFRKFVHPHFNPPAYSFGWYFYAINSVQVSENHHSLRYTVNQEFLNDGSMKLSMDEEFGEYLKRHAYYYYEMLYQTTKEYIKFIEESFEAEEDN